jgi:hypothetical protein
VPPTLASANQLQLCNRLSPACKVEIPLNELHGPLAARFEMNGHAIVTVMGTVNKNDLES